MSWGAIVVTVASTAVSLYGAKSNRETAEGIAEEAAEAQRIETAKLDKQKAEYKAMDFKNPFADMENVYSENVFEDLTVNQQQAQFQAQQGSQQRANIMQGLRGAAGGSGVAGLAQALANQGQLQTQQISASLGRQESANQRLSAQGALNVQRGAAAVQIAERQGDQFVQQSEMNRQATLLGMQMGETSGANIASQQAQANQMNAQIAEQESYAELGEAAGKVAGAATDAMGKKIPA